MLTKPTPGILLYGLTGCGKSLIVDVVANECGTHCIQLVGRQVTSVELEHHLHDAFEEAERNAPALIIFNEIDLMFPKSNKMVGTQLCWFPVFNLLYKLGWPTITCKKIKFLINNRVPPSLLDLPMLLFWCNFSFLVQVEHVLNNLPTLLLRGLCIKEDPELYKSLDLSFFISSETKDFTLITK